ncbi:MAG: hypothetical protein PHX83_06765 [Acidobacteriia bacterium]|nr:hypothetical protein [Terriglobia bacterium]
MKLYEVINPSDAVTFYAPDDATAVAVALTLGEGHYGAKRCEDDVSVGGLLLFCKEKEAEQRIFGWLNGSFPEWCDAHDEALTAALESCATVAGQDDRFVYDKACSGLSGAELEAFKAEVQDRNRSSINDITGRAWKYAKVLRKNKAAKK